MSFFPEDVTKELNLFSCCLALTFLDRTIHPRLDLLKKLKYSSFLVQYLIKKVIGKFINFKQDLSSSIGHCLSSSDLTKPRHLHLYVHVLLYFE